MITVWEPSVQKKKKKYWDGNSIFFLLSQHQQTYCIFLEPYIEEESKSMAGLSRKGSMVNPQCQSLNLEVRMT